MDAVRLAVGTLTVLPSPAPRRVDPSIAGRAMVLAPLVGAVIGGLAGAVVAGVGALRPDAPLLAAALGVVTLVGLSGALHLDGLADTADGLGSRRPRDEMLRIMRQGDVGPFGVVTTVLVLLVDVAALTTAVAEGIGWQALLIAGLASRLTLPWACRVGVPPARPEGLGAMVASTVRPVVAAIVSAAAVIVSVVILFPVGVRPAVAGALAVAGSLAVGAAVTRRARQAIGGITGDTLGAGIELGSAAALVALALTS